MYILREMTVLRNRAAVLTLGVALPTSNQEKPSRHTEMDGTCSTVPRCSDQRVSHRTPRTSAFWVEWAFAPREGRGEQRSPAGGVCAQARPGHSQALGGRREPDPLGLPACHLLESPDKAGKLQREKLNICFCFSDTIWDF